MGDDFIILDAHGFPVNHYRVKDGQLEFRCVDAGSRGMWRTLSTEDVLMHLVLKTTVAEWLYVRRGLKPGVLGRAA
jgi:hypothetical protein